MVNITKNILDHSRSKHGARLVLLVLAYRANKLGYCYPGRKWIQRRTNLSETAVKNAMAKLQKDGELLVRVNCGRHQRNDFLVLPNLSDDEILQALKTHFNLSEHIAQKILSAIREGADLRRIFPSSDAEKGQNPPQKGAESEKKGAESEGKGSESEGKGSESAPPLIRSDTFSDSFLREESLSQINPEVEAALTALYQACGKRKTRRNRKKFETVAEALLAEGFTAAQITLTRRWWDSVGLGKTGGSPPHPHQVSESIAEAIKWAAKGTTGAANGSGGEYARAGQQPTYSPEERARVAAQLQKEEDDGF